MPLKKAVIGFWSFPFSLNYCPSSGSGSQFRNWPKPRFPLPASRLLVVENEQCIHLLPETLPDTLAILGSGLDLQWLASAHLAGKQIAYLGDMDTWGLLMLARARLHQPAVEALLMEQELSEQHSPVSAVVEPTKALESAPLGLLADKADFYRYLLVQERGRLEQEYLPKVQVERTIEQWARKIPA